MNKKVKWKPDRLVQGQDGEIALYFFNDEHSGFVSISFFEDGEALITKQSYTEGTNAKIEGEVDIKGIHKVLTELLNE